MSNVFSFFIIFPYFTEVYTLFFMQNNEKHQNEIILVLFIGLFFSNN